MLSVVLENDKVSADVARPVVVDVMNDRARRQSPAERAFSHNDVFKTHAADAFLERHVAPIVDPPGALSAV